MTDSAPSSLADRLDDTAAMAEAVGRAVVAAILAHAKAGNPVAAWENGRVVWRQPDEVFRRLAAADTE